MSTSSHTSSSPSNKGFTLIELLVVVMIIVIITSVILIQESKFDSSTLLRSLAYQVALSLRQAQVYGTAVFGSRTNTASPFGYYSGYGVALTQPASGPLSTYLLFADVNKDGTYTSAGDQTVKSFSTGVGYSVSKFCVTNAADIQSCSTDGAGAIRQLTIIFNRPNPDACITTDVLPGLCAPLGIAQYKSAYIQILSPAGATRSITVSSTGQISIGAASS